MITDFVWLVVVDGGTASERRVVTRNDAAVVIDHTDEIVDGVARSYRLRQVRRQIQTPGYRKRKKKQTKKQTTQISLVNLTNFFFLFSLSLLIELINCCCIYLLKRGRDKSQGFLTW